MKTSERQILKGYYWNHDAIRKDINRLTRLEDRLTTLKTEDFNNLQRWFEQHKVNLVLHHEAEDDFFFPLIAGRTDSFRSELEAFDHEHKQLDVFTATIGNLLTHLAQSPDDVTRQKLKDEIAGYRQLVISHLDKEEQVIESATHKHFTKEEVLEAEEEYRSKMPKKDMSRIMPWMVDAMNDEDRKLFFSMIPGVAKWIYLLFLKRKYNKLIASFE